MFKKLSFYFKRILSKSRKVRKKVSDVPLGFLMHTVTVFVIDFQIV